MLMSQILVVLSPLLVLLLWYTVTQDQFIQNIILNSYYGIKMD